MVNKDIRWKQRFANFKKAFGQLNDGVQLSTERNLTDLEQQGLIQAFEFTHELAWNVMRDYFKYQGNTSITGSRDASREAFKSGLISDGEGWMEMVISRNKTSHTYNTETVKEIVELICETYVDLFKKFQKRMEELDSGEQLNLLNEG